jgi:hypothetical protein
MAHKSNTNRSLIARLGEAVAASKAVTSSR